MSGDRANSNGQRAQDLVQKLLEVSGYVLNPFAKTLSMLSFSKHSLFPEVGQFGKQVKVPLLAHYHQGSDRYALVDFVVRVTKTEDVVLLSIKSQEVNGTADGKLEYEIQQLIATELPAAMLVLGPMRGRDAEQGWNPHVLGEIWERSRYYGANRVFLFRSAGKLERWMMAGTPVGGRGVPPGTVFAEYCDREP